MYVYVYVYVYTIYVYVLVHVQKTIFKKIEEIGAAAFQFLLLDMSYVSLHFCS